MTSSDAVPDTAVAIDVGGTTIKGELVDRAGRVLATARRPTPGSDGALVAIGELGDELLGQAGTRGVAGAGVVVPGLVDPRAGVATYSANIGWRDLQLTEPLAARWRTYRCGSGTTSRPPAAAETRHGAGRGESHVAFVVIGTGIAAAVVSGGRLVSGPRGEIAELGHVPVRTAPRCACGGDGCLEAVASASAIAERYTELSGETTHGAADVVARLHSDPVAREVWQDAIEALADGIAVLSLLAAPEVVVVGGGLAVAGPDLIDPLGHAVKRAHPRRGAGSGRRGAARGPRRRGRRGTAGLRRVDDAMNATDVPLVRTPASWAVGWSSRTASSRTAWSWRSMAAGSRTSAPQPGGPGSRRSRSGTIAPGFVDIHCHGGGGHTVTTGDPADVADVGLHHLRHGTTAMLASLVSAPDAEIEAGCSRSPRWPSPARPCWAATSRDPSSARATAGRTTRPTCARPTWPR